MNKIKVKVLIVATCVFFLGTLGSKQTSWGEEGLHAPSFVLPDLKGQLVSSADREGDIILINFWATWCNDCIREMPEFEKLYQKYKDKGLSIFAIALDKQGRPTVETFLKKENLSLTYPILLDPEGEISRAYRVAWVPVTIIVGRNGKIMETILGIRPWGSEAVMKSFDRLLNQPVNNLKLDHH